MKIAFVGGGHIARALIAGLYQQAEITVADPHEDKRRQLVQDFQVQAVEQLPPDLIADVIVLAVRPAQAQAACAGLPAAGLLLSVMAGVRSRQLQQWSGRAAAQVVRAMPNTPAQVGHGMTFAYADAAAEQTQRQQVARLFNGVGQFDWVESEELLDAVTAVCGSGPAYVYYIVDALCEAAQRLGFDEASAQTAVLQTIRGACAMIAHNPHSTPAQLCAAVAVPGGTTERGLSVMQQAEIKAALIKAVAAANERARELGDQLANSAGRDG